MESADLILNSSNTLWNVWAFVFTSRKIVVYKKRERKDKKSQHLKVKSSKLKMATTNLYGQKFIPVFPACIFSLIQVLHEISFDFLLSRTSLLNSIRSRRFILELIALARKWAKREEHHTENIQINLNS